MKLLAAFVWVLFSVMPRPATAADRPRRETTAEIQTRINNLFTAAKYDSILALIPGYIHRAEAEHDSVLLGRMYAQRGRTLTMIGRGAEGVHDIDRGIRLAEATRDTVGWMPAVHFKGYYYTTEARYDEAMPYFEKRMQLAQRVRSPLDEALARTSIGYVYIMRGDYERARESYTRAVMCFRRSESPQRETVALGGLGRVEASVGNEQEAKACWQRAWVVARTSGDRVSEMWTANDLGVLEATGGDPARSEAYSQRAFDIAREIDFPPGMVIPAINLAARAKELGDYTRADSLLTDARNVCVTRGVAEHLNAVDFSLAELRLIEGRYGEAGAAFRRLLAVPGQLEPQQKYFAVIGLARVMEHADSVSQAIELMNAHFETKRAVFALAEPQAFLLLSHLYQRAGDPAAALQRARRALACAEHLGWHRVAVTARLRESGCYRALGRRSEARASLLAGLDSLDTARGGIATPEWREIYGQETAHDVVDACRILLEYPDELSARTREAAFFDSVQRFKTRSLLDRISEPRDGAPHEAEPASLPAATVDKLQHNILRKDELLLEFFVGSDESYLAAISTDDARLVKLPGPDSPLAESIDLYHHALASADAALQADFPPERMASIQRSIGDAVLGDVADLIIRAKIVLVAPDGFFASIPFGTLMLKESPRMLMETIDVVQVPSASVLALQRTRATGERREAARIVALEAATATLPGAHDEVRGISRRFAGVERVRGISGGADELVAVAARGDVLHVAAHAFVVDESPWQSGLRLAPDSPGVDSASASQSPIRAASDVILSTADSTLVARTFRADPFVRAWQIARLSLPTQLTVLAACETAGGRLTNGEGVLGLTAAFMSAGVPVVVSSLWPIDDRTTARMMERFYDHLAQGESVATSLRLAQMSTRREQPHPFYWAGFTVVGDGSAVVPLQRTSRARSAILAGSALALVGVTLAWMYRRRNRVEQVSRNSV